MARHEAVEWGDRHPRSYHYGVKRKSCERAVWEQSLAVENHGLMGFTTGLTLLDLTKAYEKKWFAPCSSKPRLLIAKYRGPRVLSLSGVCSDVVHSSQTILAGCPFATTLLRLFLLSPLDKVCEHFPPAAPFNVVDDIALFMGGAAKVAQTRLGNATAYLCGLLEGQLLVISESKGKVLPSCSSAARGLAKRLSKWEFTAPAATRNLGCDFGMGPKGRRSRPVVGSRCRKIKGRLSKFRSLRSSFQGLMKVIRGGALPQGMCGAVVKGLDDRILMTFFGAVWVAFLRKQCCTKIAGLWMSGARFASTSLGHRCTVSSDALRTVGSDGTFTCRSFKRELRSQALIYFFSRVDWPCPPEAKWPPPVQHEHVKWDKVSTTEGGAAFAPGGVAVMHPVPVDAAPGSFVAFAGSGNRLGHGDGGRPQVCRASSREAHVVQVVGGRRPGERGSSTPAAPEQILQERVMEGPMRLRCAFDWRGVLWRQLVNVREAALPAGRPVCWSERRGRSGGGESRLRQGREGGARGSAPAAARVRPERGGGQGAEALGWTPRGPSPRCLPFAARRRRATCTTCRAALAAAAAFTERPATPATTAAAPAGGEARAAATEKALGAIADVFELYGEACEARLDFWKKASRFAVSGEDRAVADAKVAALAKQVLQSKSTVLGLGPDVYGDRLSRECRRARGTASGWRRFCEMTVGGRMPTRRSRGTPRSRPGSAPRFRSSWGPCPCGWSRWAQESGYWWRACCTRSWGARSLPWWRRATCLPTTGCGAAAPGAAAPSCHTGRWRRGRRGSARPTWPSTMPCPSVWTRRRPRGIGEWAPTWTWRAPSLARAASTRTRCGCGILC
ncbi:unnamed protein product [Prorocentrum cordatum]|uniref:Uncharacterized protein n=1 Tax=Prorocentrum cordatum TaxID=2364126 RepID=A0ABN9XU65_9DINO|nr:unnamed protein product [Polarella glacialis]